MMTLDEFLRAVDEVDLPVAPVWRDDYTEDEIEDYRKRLDEWYLAAL